MFEGIISCCGQYISVCAETQKEGNSNYRDQTQEIKNKQPWVKNSPISDGTLTRKEEPYLPLVHAVITQSIPNSDTLTTRAKDKFIPKYFKRTTAAVSSQRSALASQSTLCEVSSELLRDSIRPSLLHPGQAFASGRRYHSDILLELRGPLK